MKQAQWDWFNIHWICEKKEDILRYHNQIIEISYDFKQTWPMVFYYWKHSFPYKIDLLENLNDDYLIENDTSFIMAII